MSLAKTWNMPFLLPDPGQSKHAISKSEYEWFQGRIFINGSLLLHDRRIVAVSMLERHAGTQTELGVMYKASSLRGSQRLLLLLMHPFRLRSVTIAERLRTFDH
ncbi:hypothetical protein AKJ16_DCAP08382 [Drosera capensis]